MTIDNCTTQTVLVVIDIPPTIPGFYTFLPYLKLFKSCWALLTAYLYMYM